MLLCIIPVSLGAGDDCANTHDRVFQRHQVLLAGIPENSWVGIVVIVPENIADTGDCAPGDVRFINLKLLGKAAAGFRSNLKISFDKLPSTPTRAKPLEVIPCNIRLDVGDSLEHVTDIDC